MNPLARSFLAGLERGAPDARVLETVGEPDPIKAVESFSRAASHPDLKATRANSGPALLLSARPGLGPQSLAELATR